MLRNYTSSFLDTELDFFKFHKHENGQAIFTITLSSWQTMQHVT